MAFWRIKFFPPIGENHSPEDFIEQIQPADDAARIVNSLKTISELKPIEWQNVKRFQNIYQLTCGSYRLYFDIDEDRLIVVCYICRKRSQKSKKKDLDQVQRNLQNYYQRKRDG